MLEFVDEILRGDERVFANVPIDGSSGVGLRLVAKTDLHRPWPH